MNYIKQNHLSLLIILWIVVSAIFSSPAVKSFGASTVLDTTTISNRWIFNPGTLKIGGSGTSLQLVKSGTCTLVADTSIAATSTGTGTCATVGSLAGDQVFISLATTTTKQAANFIPLGTVAGTDSTTIRLFNLTGVAAVPSATNGFGSSTQYQIFR